VARLIVLGASTAAGAGLAGAVDVPGGAFRLGGLGFAMGALAVFLEWRAHAIPGDRLFWGTVGALLGLGMGFGVGSALAAVAPAAAPIGRGLVPLLGAYLGTAIALARQGALPDVSTTVFAARAAREEACKVLDTSAIIDGRIADVCEAGFLEGVLVLPQFVLDELQHIADSSDALKRNRARRGFDVLDRLRRLDGVVVRMDGRDFPQTPGVDRKLLELAQVIKGKVVTNDSALTRLAGLSGVAALNVNELANALRPVALPGELMQVHVVKEGREAGQGVGYLDDGTMVVVDHAKRLIGQTVDVIVTSALQTTAGRMIFARPRDEEHLGR
jgi:uncharacterized protein YacL